MVSTIRTQNYQVMCNDVLNCLSKTTLLFTSGTETSGKRGIFQRNVLVQLCIHNNVVSIKIPYILNAYQ